MRILFVLVGLLTLSSCAAADFTSVTVSSGYRNVYASNISYTLGYYNSSYYNGYTVYGDHGYRYYYAPRGYDHHRYYSRPHHYVQPRHYQPRHHRQQTHVQPRHNDRRRDRNRNH